MATFWMDKRVVETNPTGGSVEAFAGIEPHDKMALMVATAHGTSTYSAGGELEAGITVSIMGRTGGVSSVVKSDSFEGLASNVTFNASTAFTIVVQPNAAAQIFARVDPIGEGGGAANHDTRIELHVVAIDL